MLFTLPFQRTTLYWGIIGSRTLAFRKDAAYDMLNRSNFNWRNLLLSLAVAVIHFIDPLTDKNRESVLILDDTLYKRNRSKSVVLLARVYDHLFIADSGAYVWSGQMESAPRP
mgnify:CR=1 FL=1